MNTDIVKALREDAKRQESLLHICDSTRNALIAADLIESLQMQLSSCMESRDQLQHDLDMANLNLDDMDKQIKAKESEKELLKFAKGLQSDLKDMQKRNEEIRANSLILDSMILSRSAPVRDEKIVKLTLENASLKAQLAESQRRERAAVNLINALEKDITVISGASDYIKPGTGVWHTTGIMLQAIENWRSPVAGEGDAK